MGVETAEHAPEEPHQVEWVGNFVLEDAPVVLHAFVIDACARIFR